MSSGIQCIEAMVGRNRSEHIPGTQTCSHFIAYFCETAGLKGIDGHLEGARLSTILHGYGSKKFWRWSNDRGTFRVKSYWNSGADSKWKPGSKGPSSEITATVAAVLELTESIHKSREGDRAQPRPSDFFGGTSSSDWICQWWGRIAKTAPFATKCSKTKVASCGVTDSGEMVDFSSRTCRIVFPLSLDFVFG